MKSRYDLASSSCSWPSSLSSSSLLSSVTVLVPPRVLISSHTNASIWNEPTSMSSVLIYALILSDVEPSCSYSTYIMSNCQHTRLRRFLAIVGRAEFQRAWPIRLHYITVCSRSVLDEIRRGRPELKCVTVASPEIDGFQVCSGTERRTFHKIASMTRTF